MTTTKSHELLARPIEDLVRPHGPFPSEDWLRRRLNLGIIPGAKLGRQWVMSDDDVRAALETFKNSTPSEPVSGPRITAASARRRAPVAAGITGGAA
jgi:hypothetical protein